MVSLTSLLVLAALFTQNSQKVPNTSYIKLIDIWYMMLIIIDFSIITCLICVEHIRLINRNPPIKVLPKQDIVNASSYYEPPDIKANNVNNHCKKIVPVVVILFLISFILTCIFNK